MSDRRRGRRGTKRANPAAVFLNIPYDRKSEKLYLAYVCGISSFGLIPRAALELQSSQRRLDRILELIKSCRYSIHDLSRVEIDRTPPPTPRFNMPFELGLCVAWQRLNSNRHTWFVYESQNFRIAKSLSDINGTDVCVHESTVKGVFRELCNTFARLNRQPAVNQMWRVYRDVRKSLPAIMNDAAAKSIFNARVFKDICVVASASADKHVT